MNTILFDNLKLADAKKLRSWWNANTKDYHFVKKMDNSKYYQLIRQSTSNAKNNKS